MDQQLDTVYIVTDNIVVREIQDELIIVPMVAGVGDMENEIFALDGTGQEIWRRIDGEKSVGRIIAELEELYNSEPGVIQRDVLGLIGEIEKRKFIVAKN